MSLFMRVIHLGQAVLSGYAAYHSYNAITNLQAYEATSEKLNLIADEIFSDSDTSPGVVAMTGAVQLGALFG